MIEVKNISKVYKIAKKGKHGIFSREYEHRRAVDDISFSINEGEIVGFIGPNGAGKSTTIKMLSGILHPDIGSICVNGYIPYKQRKKYVANIGVVFGQKSQLNWDLPLIESFELIRYIYKIPKKKYEKNLAKFIDLLDMREFINQPVRQLSLGQKMRGDIVAALLHSPKIVFFDEPTIGLDVVAKEKIREFIKYLNRTENITMIFTTHDMQDIEKVCDRLIIIDKGHKIYDGTVSEIKRKYAARKIIEAEMADDSAADLAKFGNNVKITDISEHGKICKRFEFDSERCPVNEVMGSIFSQYDVNDISIKEPEIDGIIRDIYEGELQL
ncbi:MAG: ATP-binding cassette domain-containing protein [Firmicutes bacterium]|nr:ATP-binding cassette domain-containing protein [Bacillota bacterium]